MFPTKGLLLIAAALAPFAAAQGADMIPECADRCLEAAYDRNVDDCQTRIPMCLAKPLKDKEEQVIMEECIRSPVADCDDADIEKLIALFQTLNGLGSGGVTMTTASPETVTQTTTQTAEMPEDEAGEDATTSDEPADDTTTAPGTETTGDEPDDSEESAIVTDTSTTLATTTTNAGNVTNTRTPTQTSTVTTSTSSGLAAATKLPLGLSFAGGAIILGAALVL